METSSCDELGTLVFAGDKVYSLKTGQYLVGNASSKEFTHDVAIDDPSVDIKHAAIVVTHETVKLLDLFSQFGTYIEGKKIKQFEVIELSKSAKLQFGSVICHFRNNQESDSGFLALNDSTGKDVSIIPNTPTYTNQSHKNATTASTPSSLSAAQNDDEGNESFLIKATQPFSEHAFKNNSSASVRYINSFLGEEDDDFFIPETQEVAMAPENVEQQSNDSCDMFQLNTQDFNDGDDCSNHSDNLITNLSHQISMPIPFIHVNAGANDPHTNVADVTMLTKDTGFDSDTDCEEELFHLKLDETDKSTNLDESKDKPKPTSPITSKDGEMEDAEDLEPTQMFPEDIPNSTNSDNAKDKSNSKSSLPFKDGGGEMEDLEPTQMIPEYILDSTNVGVGKDKPKSLLASKGGDGGEMEDAEYVEPTQKFPVDNPKEDDALNTVNEGAVLEAAKVSPTNRMANGSTHSDNDDDEIQPTQPFPFPTSAFREPNKSAAPTAYLDETQAFSFLIPEPRKLNFPVTAENSLADLEKAQFFPPKVQTTAINKSNIPGNDQENRNLDEHIESTQVFKIPARVSTSADDHIESTQVFKIPARVSTSADDLNYMEATQKFIVPSPFLTKKQRSPSPVLLDSDEEEHDPEFCLAATLVAGETPKPISSSKKNMPDKRQSKLNKLFGSDDDDDESDLNNIKISPVTPAGNVNVADKSLIQPTPDFAFIKLPNLKKIGMADEIFRKKSRQMERKKTVLEESSDDEDDEDDPTKLMNRLLTESESLAATVKDSPCKRTKHSPVELNHDDCKPTKHSPQTTDDNLKPAKRTVRKASSSKSIANEPETRSHSKSTRATTKRSKRDEEESKESSSEKRSNERESRSSRSSNSKSSEKSNSPSTSSSRRGVRNPSNDRQESKFLPEKKSTRQRRDKNSVDENKHEKLSRRGGENSKEDKHHKKSESRKIDRDFDKSSDKNLPVVKLENVDHPSKKRYNSSKDEIAVPKKRSKENDPSLVEPVFKEEIISLRKSSRPVKPRIIFTKMDSKPYENLIEKIGGTIVDSPTDCTVLISESIYRTWKLLSALGRGVPIVSGKLLEEWSTSKQWKQEPPNYDDYLIKDTNSEHRFKFNLRKSLERARHSPVFKRYSFYCTPNTRPVPKELQTIIECAGGKLIKKIHKNMEKPEKFYIVSDKSDICMWPDIRKLVGNVQIVSTEGILIAIMQQCVNFKAYLLSE